MFAFRMTCYDLCVVVGLWYLVWYKTDLMWVLFLGISCLAVFSGLLDLLF